MADKQQQHLSSYDRRDGAPTAGSNSSSNAGAGGGGAIGTAAPSAKRARTSSNPGEDDDATRASSLSGYVSYTYSSSSPRGSYDATRVQHPLQSQSDSGGLASASTSSAIAGNGTSTFPATPSSSRPTATSTTSAAAESIASALADAAAAKDGGKPLPRGAACSACRKRKLRCDGARPKCHTCLRLGHECAYGDPVHEKLQERTRELEAKVRTLEEELARYRLSSQAGTPDASAPESDNDRATAPAPFQPTTGYSHPVTSLPPESDTKPFIYSPNTNGGGIPTSLGAAAHSSSPSRGDVGHLQSFPYTITHPHSPQLSDLINSPIGTTQSAPLHTPHPLAAPPTTASNLATDPNLGLYSPNAPAHTPMLDLNGQALPTSYFPNWESTQGAGLQRMWGAQLPSIEVLLDLADIYFSTTHIHLPFLYRPRFIYSLHNPHSLSSPPSLSLIFAVLAIAAPYHDNPAIRDQSRAYYLLAREKIETSIAIGVQPTGKTIASLTVETVQALCICTMLEMGTSDHQRAFLSIGQAVRISAMLGLHRMDEDRLAGLLGHTSDRRLRPPALHQLPDDPLMLEECRRTMATVLCVDRLEAACVGWPTALAEHDVRLLLPCDELLFESGRCKEGDNPLWWPEDGQDSDVGPRLGTFAWFCRAVWIGQRIQSNAYGPVGRPAGGPYHTRADGLDDLRALQEMDGVLELFRHKLHWLANEQREKSKGFNAALIQTLLVLNCNFVNAHHLLVARGLSSFPYNPHQPALIGTAEYSMQRCIEGMGALYEILSQAAMYENLRTTLERSRITTFSSFLPYASYCLAFPAKFAIGDWSTLVAARNRTENVPGRVSTGPTGPILPQSDVLFGTSLDDKRLAFVDCFCDALDRMGIVWPISSKFSQMVRGDRARLAARVFERASQSPHSQNSNLGAAGPGTY